MNKLERTFLHILSYNVNISQSTYVKYYFMLREYALWHGMLPTTVVKRKGRKNKYRRCNSAGGDSAGSSSSYVGVNNGGDGDGGEHNKLKSSSC